MRPLARLIDRLAADWLRGRDVRTTPAEDAQLARAAACPGAIREVLLLLRTRDAALGEADRWWGVAADLDEQACTVSRRECAR